jgi:acyl-CoA thioester hydrolase
MSANGSKWKLTHRVLRSDGELAARHTLFGGWLDLEKRKLAPPPPELLEVMRKVDRAEKYADL